MKLVTFSHDITRVKFATFFYPNVAYVLSENMVREMKERMVHSGFDIFKSIEDFKPNNWQHPQEAKRLLVYIAGKIGDALWSTALIRKIKKLHPQMKITVVSQYDELFYNNRNISGIRFEPLLYAALEGFDAHLILDEVVAARRDWGQPGCYELLFRAAGLELEEGDGIPELNLKQEDEWGAWGKISPVTKDGIDTTEFHIVLGLHSSSEVRDVSPTLWAEIAQFYSKKFPGITIYGVSQDPKAAQVTQMILDRGVENYVPLPNKLRLRGLAALCRTAMGVISVDSMLVHMAASQNAACVALMSTVPPHVRTSTYPLTVPVWKREACPYAPCFSKRPTFHHRQAEMIEILPCYTPSKEICDVAADITLEDVTLAFTQAVSLKEKFDGYKFKTLPI